MDPLAFMQETAEQWRTMGNFNIPADTLLAFAKVESDPSEQNLRELLSLLFDGPVNPLVRTAEESESHYRPAVNSLRVIHLLQKLNSESTSEAMQQLKQLHGSRGVNQLIELIQVPEKDKIRRCFHPKQERRLQESAQEHEQKKSKQVARVFGDYDDGDILAEWYALQKPVVIMIRKLADGKSSLEGIKLPGEKDVPYLCFLKRAIEELYNSLRKKVDCG
jgi:hypothetical protein